MTNLQELNLKISYGPNDNRLRDFFIPAMAASVRYDRAAGFFSSTMLAVAAAGVTQLIANGGKMRLLCGAELSENDVAAIEEGHTTLRKQVESSLITRWALPESDYVENRLKVLAWLVSTGQLEIKVVLPKDKRGRPLPSNKSDSYYHPKEGIFTDKEGNQVAFSGSVNESATALEDNYESFMVFNDAETKLHLSQIRIRFERLWEDKEPDWIAMPIPEAVKKELLKLRPSTAPTKEFGFDDDDDETEGEPDVVTHVDADEHERIIFQFLRDVPHLVNSDRLGMETCTVKPWPHQQRVADGIVKRFPERFMLCDEVGLGKTIEAGLAIRQLVLSGMVQRALILVPKSVLVQWQEELYEKFVLNIPRYEGGVFTDVFAREVTGAKVDNPWDAHPIMLASSHLAKRRERQAELAEAIDWDLVVVDESHHARRKDFQNRDTYRPNRLLELLGGTGGQKGLCDKTRGLLLLTATPMQVHPVEVYDLLKLLGMGGRWGVEDSFLGYFEQLRQKFEDIDWEFILSMLEDYFATGGEWDERFCHVAEQRLGPVTWDQLRNLHTSSNAELIIKQFDPQAQGVLKQIATRHTPLRRHVFRNTRTLLREYYKQGLLTEKVPHRDPRPEWIEMKDEEWDLYERIEEYIRDHYQRYEAERKGLGFIMTVYRRRLTSSFYAIQCSLERRLAYLKGEADQPLLTDDDLDQDDLDSDVSEMVLFEQPEDEVDEKKAEVPQLFLTEMEYVEDFLAELRALGTDSKFEQLSSDLAEIFKSRDSVIIFTQYTDTMDYLRNKLRHVYGSQVACYSGRGGERWNGSQWYNTSKEEIKTAFREQQDVKILLCTESASEGLNLQTCGVLINFDLPWNPMRVEQRIGRIDRIGQVYERVWIRNYFYNDTVEATVYQRLDDRISSFESVVGELQPILTQVARVIEAAAMAKSKQRGELIAKEIEELNRRVQDEEVASLDLGSFVDTSVEAAADEPSPVTLPELERTIVESSAFGSRFEPHPEMSGAHLLDWHGNFQPVTFNPVLFDEHPNTLILLTFGSEVLDQLLSAVDEPADHASNLQVVRISAKEAIPLVAYFSTSNESAIRILDQLRSATSGDATMELSESLRGSLNAQFALDLQRMMARESKVAAALRKSHLSSLTEEIRQLLTQAAYVELSQAADRDLFDDFGPLDFSEQAFERLKRHKVPFAGAIRMVGGKLPKLRADNSFYLQMFGSKRDVRSRRFDTIRGRMTDRLKQLVHAKKLEQAIESCDFNGVDSNCLRMSSLKSPMK